MKKVAIFGSGGQLGLELETVLRQRGYQVTCLTRSDADITDRAAVEAVLEQADPELVINSAAYNLVDVAETESLLAIEVNGVAVGNIAAACRKRGAALVHYSTDYVFDGTAGRSYEETDEVHPIGAYAVSKLAGEFYARAYVDQYLVIRPCGVYGPGALRNPRGNFVELMLRLVREGKPIRVVDDSIVSPTYAPALAARSVDAIEAGVTGVLHIGGGTPISWYEWARKIFAAAGVEPDLTPVPGSEYPTAARRPKYSALANVRLEKLGIQPMPSLDEALENYFERRSREPSAN